MPQPRQAKRRHFAVSSPTKTQLGSRSFSINLENYLEACRICMSLPKKKGTQGNEFTDIFNGKIDNLPNVKLSEALEFISDKPIRAADSLLPQRICSVCHKQLNLIFEPLRDLRLTIDKTNLNWNAFKKERIKQNASGQLLEVAEEMNEPIHYEITEYEIRESEIIPSRNESEPVDAVSFLLKNMKKDSGAEDVQSDDDEDMFGLENSANISDEPPEIDEAILPDDMPLRSEILSIKKRIKVEPVVSSLLMPFSATPITPNNIRKVSKRAPKGDDAPSITYAERRHVCEVCSKRFLKKSNLIDHLRLHANMKIFRCEHCDRSFVQAGNYKQHLRTHTDEKPFVCKFCNKSYTQSSALKIHIRTHTGERSYKCSECPKAFTNASDLRKHGILHDPERKLTCEFCKKTMSQKVHLKNHLVRAHDSREFDLQEVVDRAHAKVLQYLRSGAAKTTELVV